MVMKRPMVAFLTQLLLPIRPARRARLEAGAEKSPPPAPTTGSSTAQVPGRVRLWNIDRLLLVWLYRLYPSLLDAIIIVQPETVIRWHRRGFRAYWRWKSCHIGGRPRIDSEIKSTDPADEPRETAVARTADPSRGGKEGGTNWWRGLLMLGSKCPESRPSAGIWSRSASLPPTTEWIARSCEDAFSCAITLPASPASRLRSVRRTHYFVQAALRLGDPASRPQATSRDQRYFQSDCRIGSLGS